MLPAPSLSRLARLAYAILRLDTRGRRASILSQAACSTLDHQNPPVYLSRDTPHAHIRTWSLSPDTLHPWHANTVKYHPSNKAVPTVTAAVPVQQELGREDGQYPFCLL